MKSVRIGIIDSGINPNHPHVGNIMGGVTITPDGPDEIYLDHIGHGTAVAGLIHLKAPDAHLIAVRVFERKLATTIDTVLSAIDWCVANQIDVINLSLGTTNPNHQHLFEAAIRRASAAGSVIVSAAEMGEQPGLPGSLPHVVGVLADPMLLDDQFGIVECRGKRVFSAPPYPRPIPGVPRERNLQGISFAVAHITGWIARLWPANGGSVDWEDILAACDQSQFQQSSVDQVS
jgi:Subtilase family